MREGLPLGAVAAALGSPETAERIALMEAATSGSMSALDAARLNLQRAGHDTAVLDGLRSSLVPPIAAVAASLAPSDSSAVQAAEELLAPLGLGRRPSGLSAVPTAERS